MSVEATDVQVVSEPLTYRADRADVSYFRDVIDHARGKRGVVADRLDRHEQEVRTHPDRGSGTGGSFAPPLWLIDHYANVPQPGRVLANDIPNFPLPQGYGSVDVPVLTVGGVTTVIADDTAANMSDITDTVTSSTVATIAGYVDASQQLLDQSPPGAHFDSAMFASLTESYNAVLETQLFNGSGSSGQLQGILGLSGINNIVYTDATPTGTELFTILGEAVAQVGDKRLQPPEKWYLTTSRGAWIATSEDSTLRPLMLAGSSAPGEFQLAQYPVRLSDAIPVNLGTGTNQDAIVLCRPSDMLLLESAPRMRTMFDIAADSESSSAGTLTVRIELHRYVASIIGRYPTGISVIQGTGMIIQSGF